MFIALKDVTLTVERDVIINIVVVVFVVVVVLIQSALEIIAHAITWRSMQQNSFHMPQLFETKKKREFNLTL